MRAIYWEPSRLEKWRTWWDDCAKQMAEFAEIEKLYKKAMILIADDPRDNVVEALGLVKEEGLPALSQFKRRRDLVPEFRKGGLEYHRFSRLQKNFQKVLSHQKSVIVR